MDDHDESVKEQQPLSEGELPDSSGSDDGGVPPAFAKTSPKEEDEDATPAKKRRRTSPNDDSLDASIALNFGSWKSSLSKRQLKRQKKKRKELEKVNDHKRMNKTSPPINNDPKLTSQQANVLQRLMQFRTGHLSYGAELPKLKTAKFKDIVYHLVHSESLGGGDTAAHSGYGRVVVVWLSMVSEKFYNESPNHFPLLKKLNPVLRFKLEHPGSQRFAKLGLEAFMLKSTDGNESSQPTSSSSSASRSSPSSPPPPRTSYLFSKGQLLENGFPVMESPIDTLGNDCSHYMHLLPWPSVDVKDSLLASESGEGDSKKELPIFSIDCEMVETSKGSELARISIVNESLDCIYDTYVKPAAPVTDYRTKFSGISEDILTGVATTLEDVHEKLKSLLPPRCIIAGHSLENDFRAMKLIHPYVIDTSCIFTPYASPLFKPKLKKLAMELLSNEIQGSEDGHDSIEDATACMKLVQKKLAEGHALKFCFNQPTESLLSQLELLRHNTGIVDKVGVVRLFGRHCTRNCESDSDADTVEQALKIIPSCELTFLQLHDMERFVKSTDRNDSTKQLKVADEIDSNVQMLIEGCPGDTLVFVVCGSSDISKVKYYQQQDFPDMRRWKDATMTARTGQVVALMVN